MAKWHLAEFDDSPDYGNNANNSMEQQAAVENAVERAQELQSQGKADDEIVRTLHAEGIAQPEEVLKMMHLRMKHDFAAPDQQPAVSTDEEYPPAPSDSTDQSTDNQLYASFERFMTNETTAGMQKGSPYPEHSYENAPDHSAPGHHLPEKVNAIYNACMRDNSDYGKEKCMRIAWAASGKHHEKGSKITYNGIPARIASLYENVYGDYMVRISTDVGSADVPAHHIDVEDAEVAEDFTPAGLMQQWLDQVPEASNREEAITASSQLRQIHTACAAAVANGKLPLAEKMRLDDISLRALIKEAEFKRLADELSDQDQRYLDNQPQYGIMVNENQPTSFGRDDLDLDSVYDQLQEDKAGVNHEEQNELDAAMTVSHANVDDLYDTGETRRLALLNLHASKRLVGMEEDEAQKVTNDYLERVERYRTAAVGSHKQVQKEASVKDEQYPDEAVFL
jgi:hypothetical protein